MKKIFCYIAVSGFFQLLIYSTSASIPLVHTISGYAFEDLNKNGIKDKNEKGIAGVAISDQFVVSITDANGAYKIEGTEDHEIVFISMPDGYKAVKSYWEKIDPTKTEIIVNFPLDKTNKKSTFSFIHASDTHISPESLERMKKLERLTDSLRPDMMLITGDLVKDALRVSEKEASSLYKLFETESKNINSTLWLVPGNHEIFGIERNLSHVNKDNALYGRKMYRHYFGPDYYSFNFGGVHFIALNSLDFDDMWYYGSIDSVQLEWLKRDVAQVSPTTPVITFQHVPFYSGGLSIQPFEESGPGRVIENEKGVLKYRHIVSNAQEVMAILNKHNYPLALSGHYHFQQKFSFAGTQTRFEQTAAVVGSSEEGYLKMPSGIMLYKVKDGQIDAGKFIALD